MQILKMTKPQIRIGRHITEGATHVYPVATQPPFGLPPSAAILRFYLMQTPVLAVP